MIIYNTRVEFIKSLPHNAIAAEIGVFRCENAVRILEYTDPKELHLIDMWKDITSVGNYKAGHDWEAYYAKSQSLGPNVKSHRMSSIDASKLFNNEYFDWVYIDAGHSYESCLSDLESWYPKIKKGGIIAGHDYSDTPHTRRKGFGVKKAVDEFCNRFSVKIAALSKCSGQEDYLIYV